MDHLLSIVHIVGWHQCRRMTGTWMGLASLNQWIKSIHTWQRSLRKGYKCGVCVALVQNVAADCCRCLAISLQCYCDSDGWGWWGGWIKGGRRRRRRRGRRRRRQQCDDSGMISFIQIHKFSPGMERWGRRDDYRVEHRVWTCVKTLDEVISQTLAWESGKMGWMVMLGVVVMWVMGGWERGG